MLYTYVSMAHALQFLIGFLFCLCVRLLPVRPPNLEPLLATAMPFGKRMGPFAGFAFGALSIVVYDALTSGWSVWTWIPAICYGCLGMGASFYLARVPGRKGYASYAVIGTLLYDAVTGLGIGPIFYGQPLIEAFTGQIPFTIMHLVGNVTLAVVLSPLLERWVAANPRLLLPARNSAYSS
jgi:uncharacterized membrane protein